jgi:hypothetical protein
MYQEGASTWSIGTLIAVPLCIALALIALIPAFLLLRWAKRNTQDYDFWPGLLLGLGCAAASLFLIVGLAVGMYPWKAEYHKYVTKVGTVETITSRLLGSSDSFQQKFVARFTDGRTFGCEDTRCSLVKPGDKLVLACKRTWQYAGVDGYDCNFIATEKRA